MIDEFGNEFEVKIERIGNAIIQTKTFKLEEGKTTLRGEHKKLNTKDCPFQDRLSCNHGIGFERCKYMKYIRTELYTGYWKCMYSKSATI